MIVNRGTQKETEMKHLLVKLLDSVLQTVGLCRYELAERAVITAEQLDAQCIRLKANNDFLDMTLCYLNTAAGAMEKSYNRQMQNLRGEIVSLESVICSPIPVAAFSTDPRLSSKVRNTLMNMALNDAKADNRRLTIQNERLSEQYEASEEQVQRLQGYIGKIRKEVGRFVDSYIEFEEKAAKYDSLAESYRLLEAASTEKQRKINAFTMLYTTEDLKLVEIITETGEIWQNHILFSEIDDFLGRNDSEIELFVENDYYFGQGNELTV